MNLNKQAKITYRIKKVLKMRKTNLFKEILKTRNNTD